MSYFMIMTIMLFMKAPVGNITLEVRVICIKIQVRRDDVRFFSSLMCFTSVVFCMNTRKGQYT